MELNCPLCGSNDTELYLSLDYCVASNAMKVQQPTSVYLCLHCSGIFKHYNSLIEARTVMDTINNQSTLHEGGGAVETRMAFDKYPKGIPKSSYIFEFIEQQLSLKATGQLLDIGCHFGAFIKAFNHKYPQWQITGVDVSDRFKTVVEDISEQVNFVTDFAKADGGYSLITMSHVLEHIEDLEYLFHFIRENLSDDGIFFLQCNNVAENPFLPLVFEQFYNFTPESLATLCQRFGLKIKLIEKNWIKKELSVLIEKSEHSVLNNIEHNIETTISQLKANQSFFNNTQLGLHTIGRQPIALLGTTYAAKWFSYLPQVDVEYFVDENPELIGTFIDSIEVLQPKDVPKSVPLVLTFPLPIAKSIKARLANIKADVVIPTELP